MDQGHEMSFLILNREVKRKVFCLKQDEGLKAFWQQTPRVVKMIWSSQRIKVSRRHWGPEAPQEARGLGAT